MEKIRFANAKKPFNLAEFSAKNQKVYFGYHDIYEYPYSSFPIRADYIDSRSYDKLMFGRISTRVAQKCASVFFFDNPREIRLATTCYEELFILAKPVSTNNQRFGFTQSKTFDIGSNITYREFGLSYADVYSKRKTRAEKTAVIIDAVKLFDNIWAIITNDSEDYILIQSL